MGTSSVAYTLGSCGAPEAPAHVPKARPCSSPSKLAVMRAREPGTSSAPVAP